VPGAIAAIELSWAALDCEVAGEAGVADSTSVCMGDSAVCSFIVFILLLFCCFYSLILFTHFFSRRCVVDSVFQDKTRLGQMYVFSFESSFKTALNGVNSRYEGPDWPGFPKHKM
jgi:hypothetical protein